MAPVSESAKKEKIQCTAKIVSIEFGHTGPADFYDAPFTRRRAERWRKIIKLVAIMGTVRQGMTYKPASRPPAKWLETTPIKRELRASPTQPEVMTAPIALAVIDGT
jgi:hypothetical protein